MHTPERLQYLDTRVIGKLMATYYMTRVYGIAEIKKRCDMSVCPPVRPSVCLSVYQSHTHNSGAVGYGYYNRSLINFEWSAWSYVPGSGRHGNEAVASATSKVFARWLRSRYAPVEQPSAGRDTCFKRYCTDTET